MDKKKAVLFVIVGLLFLILVVSAETIDVITNPDFEDGLNGWMVEGNATTTTLPQTGTYCAEFVSESDEVSQNVVYWGIEGGTAYLSFWSYANDLPVGGSLTVTYSNGYYEQSESEIISAEEGEYTNHLLNITNVWGDAEYPSTIWINVGGAAGTYEVYVDNLTMYNDQEPTPPPGLCIENGNFETGALDGWTTLLDPDCTAEVSSAIKHGGTYSLELNATGNMFYAEAYQAINHSVVNVTSWVNVYHCDAGTSFTIMINDQITFNEISYTSTTSGFEEVILNTSGLDPEEDWDIVFSSNGETDVYCKAYVDDVQTDVCDTTPPVAAFSANATSGAIPLHVAFTDSSTNSPTTWNWSFGDENYSETQNPNHIYGTAGVYSVNLTVTNDGGSDNELKIDYITASTPTPTPTPTPSPTTPVPTPPTPTPTPTPAYSDGLYWEKAIDNAGFGGLIKWLVFDNKLWVFDTINGIIYNSQDGFNYNLVTATPDPWNETIHPDYAHRFFPEVVAHEGKIYVIGSMYYSYLLNDTWSSPNGISWQKLNDNLWSTTASRVNFGLVSFDGSLVATGGSAFPGLSPAFGTFKSTNGSVWTKVNEDWLAFDTDAIATNDTIYGFMDNQYLYKSTNGVNWSYVSTPVNTTGPRGVYDGTVLNQNQYFQEFDNMLWLLGAGGSNGYYSSDNGVTWTLDRDYTEFNDIQETGLFAVFDGTVLPEAVFSYQADDIWVGGYFPQCDFFGSPLSGVGPLDVTFTDLSANDPDEWFWEFGDGYTSTDQNPTHTYYDIGTFNVSLTITNEYGSDTETKANYITIEDSLGVKLWGYVYDAYSEVAVPGASVGMEQSGSWHTKTTNGTGGYSYSYEFVKDVTINTTTEKTGYTPFPTNFSVLYNGSYQYDLYMIPEGLNGVGGYVYDEFWWQGVNAATVTMWNATSLQTNTTTDEGFYLFTNLQNGTSYNLNATKTKYDPSGLYTVMGYTENWTQQDIPLSPNYDLNLVFRDAVTLAKIYQPVTCVVHTCNTEDFIIDENTTTAECGKAGMDYALYNYTVGSEGYDTATGQIYLYDDVNGTIYLEKETTPTPTPTGNSPTLINFPHQVRFVVQWLWGEPILGVTVTATPLDSSGPWDWILNWLGMNTTPPVNTTVLTGWTGHDGSWTGMMVESVRYRVDFTNATLGVNETITIWPKEDNYLIVCMKGAQTYSFQNANCTFSCTAVNATHYNISCNYEDTSGGTTGCTFYCKNSTGSTVFTSSTGSCTSYTSSCVQPKVAGGYYTYGCTASCTGLSQNLTWDQYVSWPATAMKLVAWDAFGVTVDDVYYDWSGIALIICIGALASKTIVRFVGVFMTFFADLWMVLGWFPTAVTALTERFGQIGALAALWTFLGCATFIAIFFYMRKGAQEEFVI